MNLLDNVTNETLFDLAETIRQWAERNYQDIARITVLVVAGAILSRYIHAILHSVLQRSLRKDHFLTKSDREKRINTLTGMGSALIRFLLWLSLGITIINIIGINIAPLIASAGVIGIALGFGPQKLINDLVSGIFIISENQYRIGDYIEIEGVSGTVEDISIRTTVLRDLSGSVHHVPNGLIGVTTNKSMGFGQLNLDLIVEPQTDLEKLAKIINSVGNKIAKSGNVKDEIIEAPQFVRVTDFTGNGITVKITGKTAGGKQLEIKSALFTELKSELDKHKIKLAYIPPQIPVSK